MPFIDGDDLHPQSNVDKMSRGEALNDDDREPWLKIIRSTAADLNSKEKEISKDELNRDGEMKSLEKQKLAEVYETSHLTENDAGKDSSNDFVLGGKVVNGAEEDHENARKELAASTSLKHIGEISNQERAQIAVRDHQNEALKTENSQSASERGCVIACSALKESYRSLLRGDISSLSTSSTSISTNTSPTSTSNQTLRVVHLYLRLPPSLLLARMHARKNHFMKEGMLRSQLETLQEPNPDYEKDVIVLEAVEGGEWKDGGDGDGKGREKSKEEMNDEAVDLCRRLLGW